MPIRKPSRFASTTSSRVSPSPDGQLRRVADLCVDDAVGREVLDALRRDAHDRVALLQDAHGVHERLEVELQGLAVRAAAEPVLPARPRPRSAGRDSRTRRARSTMVAGRRPPSRWSCRRAFGAERIVSKVSIGSSWRSMAVVAVSPRGAPWRPRAPTRPGPVTSHRPRPRTRASPRSWPPRAGLPRSPSPSRACRANGSSLPSRAARKASSGRAARVGIPSASAPPTSPPTMWWAARNGRPRPTRASARAVAVV